VVCLLSLHSEGGYELPGGDHVKFPTSLNRLCKQCAFSHGVGDNEYIITNLLPPDFITKIKSQLFIASDLKFELCEAEDFESQCRIRSQVEVPATNISPEPFDDSLNGLVTLNTNDNEFKEMSSTDSIVAEVVDDGVKLGTSTTAANELNLIHTKNVTPVDNTNTNITSVPLAPVPLASGGPYLCSDDCHPDVKVTDLFEQLEERVGRQYYDYLNLFGVPRRGGSSTCHGVVSSNSKKYPQVFNCKKMQTT